MRSLVSHRQGSPRTRLVVGLVLLLLALRALIPAGYMPQADAMREGRFVMTICLGMGGMKTVVVDADGDPVAPIDHADQTDLTRLPMSGGSPDDPSLHLEQCPFGLLASLAALPVIWAIVALVLFAATVRVVAPRRLGALCLRACGPPLGSRAPPLLSLV